MDAVNLGIKRCIRKKAKSFVVEDGEMTFPHLKKVKKHGTKKVAKSGRVPTALLMPGLVCHSHLRGLSQIIFPTVSVIMTLRGGGCLRA